MAPIHDAVLQGDLAEVKRLVQADAAVIHAPDDDTEKPLYTPLLYAVQEGDVAIIACLLDQAVPPFTYRPDDLGLALRLACMVGHEEVASLLVARGAHPSLHSRSRTTPLMYACIRGHMEVARCLLRHQGSLLDAVDQWGQTALYHGACFGHAGVVSLLLQAGADPTIADQRGLTPLGKARDKARCEVVALLEVRGVDKGGGVL